MGDPALGAGGMPPPPPPPPPAPRPPRASRPRSEIVLIAALGLLLVAGGALAAVTLTGGSEPADAPPAAVSVTSTSTVTRPDSTASGWPGGTGYTVFLASMRRLAGARLKQQQALDAGLQAGILRTSDFTSLTPGYWGVFSGTYSTRNAAAARVAAARAAGFSDAYVRFVAP